MTRRAASMIVAKRSLKWAALVAIALIGPAQLICGVRAFSLPTASKQASPQPPPAQQSQSTTSLPALLTTIAQENAKQAMGVKTATRQPQHLHRAEGSTRQRSSNEGEHDDMVPLATINNHSRNNQAALRPPQYVDVSALVGARNSSGSPASLPAAAAAAGANSVGSSAVLANSMLSAKSRSGLPECATQQVCNAIFVRMNHTQRLCECSSNYNWKCSNTLDPQDGHTIELTRKFDKRIYTQIKTCEPLREVRACKSPTDWTLLALQSERSGKAHYVVVCKCPTWAQLEGPYTHNHPPYANIPGIRVYGMLCAHQTARSSTAQTYAAYNPALSIYPEFPWSEALNVLNTTNLASTLDAPAH